MRRNCGFLALLMFLIVSPMHYVNASSEEVTLSIATDEIEIAGGVKVKASYNVPACIHHQKTMVPDEEAEWAVSASTGEIDLQIYVPSPINQWLSVTKKKIPLGLGVDIDIPAPIPAATIKARVKTHMTASLSVDGPATLNKNELTWSADGSQVFNVRANGGSEGNQIEVMIGGNLGISISLVVNVAGLYELDIGLTDLGVFDFQPISQSTSIVPDWRVLQARIDDLQGQITTLQDNLNSLREEHSALINSPPYSTVNTLIAVNIATVLVAAVIIVYLLKKRQTHD